MVVPGVNLTNQALHSLAYDQQNNIWFAQAGPQSDPTTTTSLGYIISDWSAMVLFPPLSLFPFVSNGTHCTPKGTFVSFNGSGIAIDPITQEIWFADFCRKRLGRLKKEGNML